MPEKKTCIVICGPTAVGKTRVSIEVAKAFGCSIISADSRQCYRELNIGVARPTQAELAEVPHYFIASHSITENITAAYFEQYALETCSRLFNMDNTVVMVGGTGLYIKAFCDGLDNIPPADERIRVTVTEGYLGGGIDWLRREIEMKDPLFFKSGELKNPRRMLRALEVILQTGRSILSFYSDSKIERPFSIIKVGLELPRPELYARINSRVEKMMDMGLLSEVESLHPYKDFNALQTVGYRELFDHLEGKISIEEAVDLISKNTRQYAKRQLTWFKKDKALQWLAPEEDEVFSFLKKKMQD